MNDTAIPSSSLRGRHVIDKTGTDIGSVADVTLDPKAWHVSGLVVNVRREVASRMPLQTPMFGEPQVTFGTERIQSVGDNVMLNVTANEIAGLLFSPTDQP